ncbi:hypothetical protein THIOSC15_2720020 [uncultured Thiomicrorhabdus sp.]
MKVFKEIRSIVMADDNNVEYVNFEKIDPDFIKDLNGYYEGDVVQASNETRTPISVEQALKMSADAPVTGYGSYSGQKLWQLPSEVIEQIKKMLIAVEVN